MPFEDANICPVCQRQNKQDTTECAYCGEPLRSVITIIVPEKPMGKTDQEHLEYLLHQHYDGLVLFVAGQKQPIILKNLMKIVLGRQEGASTTPLLNLTPYGAQSLGVSRQHAMIKAADNGRYVIEDMNSTNGTFVNENRLKPDMPQTLYNGDLMRLGQLIMFVYYQAEGEQARVLEQNIVLVTNPLLPEPTPPPGLSVSRMNEHLTPFLLALSELQRHIDTIRGKLAADTNVISLATSASLITVGLSGGTDAVQILREIILPWRRKYGVASLKATTRLEPDADGDTEAHIHSGQESDPTITSEALAAHTRRIMQNFQDELIPAVMTQISTTLTPTQQTAYREQLTPHLRTLSFSSLELSSD